MLFKALAIVGFAATTVVADGASIVAALNKIRTDNAQLNNTLVNWDGGLFTAIPILIASGDVDNDIKDGTSTANASGELTVDEAVAVYTATQGLQSDTVITIDNLIAAKPKFDKLGVTFITQNNIKTTRSDAAAFGQAVVAKVPAAYQDFANTVVAQINDQFNRAATAYGVN